MLDLQSITTSQLREILNSIETHLGEVGQLLDVPVILEDSTVLKLTFQRKIREQSKNPLPEWELVLNKKELDFNITPPTNPAAPPNP
jgi:hypothetical protein